MEEDFDVLAYGKVVGRIYEPRGSRFSPPELRWFWSVTAIVPPIPNVTNGHARTREEAMAKFREAWNRLDAPTVLTPALLPLAGRGGLFSNSRACSAHREGDCLRIVRFEAIRVCLAQ
jgi:hypothetical protein